MTKRRQRVRSMVIVAGMVGYFSTGSMCAYASLPAAGDSNSFLVGLMVFLGAQVLIVIGLAGAVRRWMRAATREDITVWANDEASPFGRHRVDASAHEPMRKQMATDSRAEFTAVRQEMKELSERHAREMETFAALVRPIIEQNTYAMRLMAGQMRRNAVTGDGEER